MKRLLFVADTHSGSAYGLWPPGFGAELNPVQAYIWQCWEHMNANLPRLDSIVLIAEQTEGSNVKEDSKMIVETDRSRQVEGFLQAFRLGPLRKLKRNGTLHVLTGSQYHLGNQSEGAHHLGALLAAEGLNISRDAFDHPAHTWLHLDVEGVRFDIAHLQSTTIAYRSMPLEREMLHMLMRQGDDDVIVRAHAHNDVIVSIGHRWAIACPPWKCQDGYAAGSRTPNRWRTERIGSVLVESDGAAKERGDDPICIRKYYYPTPKIERIYHEA